MQQRIIAQHTYHVDRGGQPLRKTFHINQWRRLIPQTFVDPVTKQPVNIDTGGWIEIARDALPKAPVVLKDEVKIPEPLKQPAKAKTPGKKGPGNKKTQKPKATPPPPADEPKAKEKIKFE